MSLPALPSWPLAIEGQVVCLSFINLCWDICHYNSLYWGGQCIGFGCGTKRDHQGRASSTSWVNSSGLKRLAGYLNACFSQNRRECEWSLTRGRAILSKLVRPSSIITPLYIGNKAILATWAFVVYTFSFGNEMVICVVLNVRPR